MGLELWCIRCRIVCAKTRVQMMSVNVCVVDWEGLRFVIAL